MRNQFYYVCNREVSHAFVYSRQFVILLLQTHMLLMDAFLQNNRLDHVSRVMSSHPKYLEHFLRTQHFILRGDGPLPYDYRHLIAIMVSIQSLVTFSAICVFFQTLPTRIVAFSREKKKVLPASKKNISSNLLTCLFRQRFVVKKNSSH